MKIVSVRFIKEDDVNPDLSYYGAFTDKPSNWVIVRRDSEYLAVCQEDEQWEMPTDRYNARFFKPNAGEQKEGTADYIKYGKQDYERMEAYERDEWRMLHCYVRTTIEVNGTLQTLRSTGLGSVESDMDKSEFESIKDDEIAELSHILMSLGFDKKDIEAAFEGMKDE